MNFKNPDPEANHLFYDAAVAIRQMLNGEFPPRYKIMKDTCPVETIRAMRYHSLKMMILGCLLGLSLGVTISAIVVLVVVNA